MKFDLHRPLHRLVIGGVLSAMILLLTIVVAVPIPHMAGAYINLGDVGVYLAAYVLGPWGALCAATGSALADLLLGSVLYAPATAIIKGLVALIAGLLFRRHKWGNYLPMLLAGILMPAGYLVFEAFLYGMPAAILGLPANLLQYAAGIALGIPVLRIATRILHGKRHIG